MEQKGVEEWEGQVYDKNRSFLEKRRPKLAKKKKKLLLRRGEEITSFYPIKFINGYPIIRLQFQIRKYF